jgi:H-type lectin domain
MRMLSGFVRGNYQSDGWSLHEGEGERSFAIHQTFSKPFDVPPLVVIGFSELDASAGPLRARVNAADIGPTGFNATIETWADSTLYGAAATWVAYEA